MKIYLILILLFGNSAAILGQAKETFVGNYLVTKIHIADDYYLIFLEKDNKRYTIHSDKNLREKMVNGLKIQKDSTYYLELLYTPPKFEIMNYGEIVTSYGFRGFEIGKLCSAKNLVGLTIISMDNGSKLKRTKRRDKN